MGSSPSVFARMKYNYRAHPPSSYSLKIHNFSQHENSTLFTNNKIKSRPFSSGGYNWRLIVYPKGSDGSDIISMFVELDMKSWLLTTSTKVYAELRFFIYNKKINEYYTMQDADEKRFEFTARDPVWGLPHILPFDVFSDPENGYLFEGDQCEFGVDVIVAPPIKTWEIVSFSDTIHHPNFSLRVRFFELKEEVYTSTIFSVEGRNWVIKLYPKGISSEADGKWLSVYLSLAEAPKAGEKILTQGHVRLLNPLGSNHLEYKLNFLYDKFSLDWGWNRFCSLAELYKVYFGKEDTLNVEIEFEVVSETTYTPIISRGNLTKTEPLQEQTHLRERKKVLTTSKKIQ